MRCSITGEEATEPVVSPKSGAIFERKHILNYIQANGKDPINDQPLSEEELISINSDESNIIVPPKQPNATSIPAMLANFQNEWDAMALEVFTLRKQLFTAREELSSSLYQYDAAVRVAAKALKERDEARDALRELSLAVANGTDSTVEQDASTPKETSSNRIPVDELNAAKTQLFEEHKANKLSNPIGNSKKVILKNSVVTAENKETQKSQQQIISNGNIVTYSEKTVYIQKYNSESVITKSFESPVNACDLSADGTLITVHDDAILSENYTTKVDGKDIFEIKCHPLLPHLVVGLSKHWWGLFDIEKGLLYQSPESALQYTTVSFHVDGLLIAIGTNDSLIEIYSLTDGALATSFTTKHSILKKIQFALNGYWMILLSKSTTATTEPSENCIEVFDLRKNINVHSLELDEVINDFTLDASSSLLATSSNSLHLHSYAKKGKKWNQVDVEGSPSDLEQILFAPYEKDTIPKVIGCTNSSDIVVIDVQ